VTTDDNGLVTMSFRADAAGDGLIGVNVADSNLPTAFAVFTITGAPVDCVVSEWSDCTVPCGGGTQTRTRSIVTQPANGGAACLELQETRECNTDCNSNRSLTTDRY
jgi:hypothetical protein